MNKRLTPPLVCTGISTLLLCLVGIEGTGRLVLDPRNIGLTSSLSACESRESVGGDIRVGYTLGGNIVFDMRSCKGQCRMIDPLHLFMQFGYKIKDHHYSNLLIAASGEEVYRIDKRDLDELADQYSGGARFWAFDHWPERLKKPTGDRAFESWSGGFLGAIKGQLDDLNEALKSWVGKAASVSRGSPDSE